MSMLCPSVLSYDWQLGSVPLVTSLTDIRVMFTIIGAVIIMFLTKKIFETQNRYNAETSLFN